MDCHRVTKTGGLWVLRLQQNMFHGLQLDYFHSQTTILCGIGIIICGGEVTGRSCLDLLLIVVERGPTVSRYS